MGLPMDDAVMIQKGKRSDEPYVITVIVQIKPASDVIFAILFSISDSTLPKECYVVLWLVPHSSSSIVRWVNLKERLLSVCPTCSVSFYLNEPSPCPASSPVYLLTFCSCDRRGLLHVFCELELTIQRVKVTTTPDDRVLDIFFITDHSELLYTKERQNETYKQLHAVLGQSCSCELQLVGPQYDNLQCISSLSPSVSEELFRCELSDNVFRTQALSPDMTQLKKASVTIDNSLSPGHTLLQIGCVDHKGFLYDIMRTLKDCNIQIAYGRFSSVNKGLRELDLFIRQKDGKKIVDPDKRDAICSRLKVEMLHPLRVIITNRGPDTELLVANHVELDGKGRPRVFYDVTLALKTLGICIFSAEIGRHCTSDREWEFYRFLLDEDCRFDMSSMVGRNQIVNKVRRTLMGW
ncbi:hypothetical protein R3W88_030551 [Solanum pinnatisectum]|uniref:ACT domain-containing protein ACR n=1 Tax=Solanum pinnatisectum TaxID=50273 RepID=A0AAV9K8X0_9SOLN|nr:hypothetical protein R3W88_030551 [Solanum pinnatisectum]